MKRQREAKWREQESSGKEFGVGRYFTRSIYLLIRREDVLDGDLHLLRIAHVLDEARRQDILLVERQVTGGQLSSSMVTVPLRLDLQEISIMLDNEIRRAVSL